MRETRGKPTMRLYVNVDHVATVRQARRTDEPDPVAAAAECERAGADGITVHLREDHRHIQPEDVRRLSSTVRTVLNLELAVAGSIVDLAAALRPHQATFVPERRAEITTEGGLDLSTPRRRGALRRAIDQLTQRGIRISLFIDPDRRAVELAAGLGVAAIELHTGAYAHRGSPAALKRLHAAAQQARRLGLAVHAGHGLTYRNVGPVAAIAEIEELNIGHSIVSRSIFTGMASAVREMRALVDPARVDQPSIRP